MEITTKQLRTEPGKIVTRVANGQEITITYRGKPCVKMIPLSKHRNLIAEDSDDELFGIWKDSKDTENVDKYVRNLRKGRKF